MQLRFLFVGKVKDLKEFFQEIGKLWDVEVSASTSHGTVEAEGNAPTMKV